MATKGSSLFVSIGLKGLDQFDRDLKSAEKSLARTGRNLKSIGKDFSLAFTAPLVGIGTLATKAAMDFERGFQPVATLVGDNVKRMNELKKGVLDLSVVTGKGATDIAGNLGLAMEKFGDVADVMDRVSIIMKLAKIAQADYAAALDYSHDMADAYNDESLKMLSTMADHAAMARRLNVSFTEYAKGMGTCAAFASVLGISQTELAAQYITLVKATGDAGLASSQLKMIYAQLIKPSTELNKMMDRMGASSGKQLIATRGFLGALELLKSKSAETGKEMESMFKRAGSIVAIEKFLGKAAEFQQTLRDLGVDAGEVERQFKGLEKGNTGVILAWDRFKAQIKRVTISLGEELLGIMPDVIAGLQPIIDQTYKIIKAFGDLDPATKKTIIGFLATVAAIGPFILWGGLMVNSLRALTGAARFLLGVLEKIPAAFAAIRIAAAFISANPIIIAATAVILLVGWLYKWRDTWREMFGPMGNAIANFVRNAKEHLSNLKADYVDWRDRFTGTIKGLGNLTKDEVTRINEELAKIKFMEPGGVARGVRTNLPVGRIAPTPAWKPEGLLDRVIRDRLLGEYDAGMKKMAADTKAANAAIEASMTGTQRVVRDAIGEIQDQVSRIGPTIMRMNEAVAASGGKLTFPVVGVLRNFAAIDEQMKRLKETVEILNVVSPETAKVVDEEFKKISASLEAVRPYAERLVANFKTVQETITAEMGLACNNIKRDLANLPKDIRLPVELEVTEKLFKPGELGKAPGYKINLGDIKGQTEEVIGFFDAMNKAVKATVDEMGKGFGARLDDMKYMIYQWGDDFTTTIQDALRTGNWDFAKFVDQIIADITRLLLYTYVTTPIFQAFAALINSIGGGGGGGGAIVGAGVGNVPAGPPSLGKKDIVTLGNRISASFEAVKPPVIETDNLLEKGDLGKMEESLSKMTDEMKKSNRENASHADIGKAAPKISFVANIPDVKVPDIKVPAIKIPAAKMPTPPKISIAVKVPAVKVPEVIVPAPVVNIPAIKTPPIPAISVAVKIPSPPKSILNLKIPPAKDSLPAMAKMFGGLWESIRGSIAKITPKVSFAVNVPPAPAPLITVKMPAMPKISIVFKLPAVKDSMPVMAKMFNSIIGSIGKLTGGLKAAIPKAPAIQRVIIAMKTPMPRVITESGVSPAFRMSAAFASGTARLSRELLKDSRIGAMRPGMGAVARPVYPRGERGVSITVIDQRRKDSPPIKAETIDTAWGKKISILVRDSVRADMNSGKYDGDFQRNFKLSRWGGMIR